jgi:UDP-glucose 4-epimerase
MRVLITGGAGFIGSHIAEHYQGKAEVRILDNLRTGYLANLEGLDVDFITGDILDKDTLAKAMEGVDYVFHLAAMISVPESMEKPVECVRMNAEGTLNVLEAAAAAGAKKLCFSTSAAIYGDNPTVPKREDMFPEPKSPYAVTKLDGEYYCAMFAREGKLPTVALRYFNVFGPRQDPNSAYAAAVPIFIAKALEGEPLTIFGDGGQTRDFVYVKDIVAANAFMAENNETGVFNVAYGGRTTIGDLAKSIIEITGSSSKIEHGPERPGDVRPSTASIEKLLATGFKPTSDFVAGLGKTIEFFQHR